MAFRMLRVAEVAELLSCSERTVRRWIADGTLQSVKVGGTRLISEAELDRLLGLVEPARLENFNDQACNPDMAHFEARFDVLRTFKCEGGK